MMKGVTPIIAIIMLLLITVALAGAAWTYLQAYMSALIGKSIEVTDAFCINGDTAVVLLRNSGTQSFVPSDEITVINATTGTVIGPDPPELTWSTPAGSTFTGSLDPNQIVRFQAPCAPGRLCSYRVISETAGRSLRAMVQC